MVVHVRLFAGLRELAGADQLELELPTGARVADALAQLDWLTNGSAVLAVNREYADRDTPLSAGDELALIPPVSGGAPEPQPAGSAGEVAGAAARASRIHVSITDQPLSADAAYAFVIDPRAGAIVTFHGITRDVPALHYEAYAEMAQEELERLARTAARRHGLCAAAIEHRTGEVAISEPSVIVAVSAPHRAEAFAGARELIDELKACAPIWKRESEEWVAGTLPTPGARPGSAAK